MEKKNRVGGSGSGGPKSEAEQLESVWMALRDTAVIGGWGGSMLAAGG